MNAGMQAAYTERLARSAARIGVDADTASSILEPLHTYYTHVSTLKEQDGVLNLLDCLENENDLAHLAGLPPLRSGLGCAFASFLPARPAQAERALLLPRLASLIRGLALLAGTLGEPVVGITALFNTCGNPLTETPDDAPPGAAPLRLAMLCSKVDSRASLLQAGALYGLSGRMELGPDGIERFSAKDRDTILPYAQTVEPRLTAALKTWNRLLPPALTLPVPVWSAVGPELCLRTPLEQAAALNQEQTALCCFRFGVFSYFCKLFGCALPGPDSLVLTALGPALADGRACFLHTVVTARTCGATGLNRRLPLQSGRARIPLPPGPPPALPLYQTMSRGFAAAAQASAPHLPKLRRTFVSGAAAPGRFLLPLLPGTVWSGALRALLRGDARPAGAACARCRTALETAFGTGIHHDNLQTAVMRALRAGRPPVFFLVRQSEAEGAVSAEDTVVPRLTNLPDADALSRMFDENAAWLQNQPLP